MSIINNYYQAKNQANQAVTAIAEATFRLARRLNLGRLIKTALLWLARHLSAGHLVKSGQLANARLFPQPEGRILQLLLSGILAKAGKLEDASRVLDNELDNEPSTTVQTNQEQPDAVIVDPGFVQMSGHHYNCNVFYKRLIETAGLSVLVFRAKQRYPSLMHDETASIPAFVLSPYEKIFPDSVDAEELQATNNLFMWEFRRVLPKTRPRLIVVHTARHTFFAGMCSYITRCVPVNNCTLILGVVEAEITEVDHPLHTIVQESYQRSFSMLAKLPGLKVLVVVETGEVARYLAQQAGPKVEILVSPYVAENLAEAWARKDQVNSSKLTVGFVGQTRVERGANLIPEIAHHTLTELGDRITWRVQLEASNLSDAANTTFDQLVHHEQFETKESNLSLSAYYDLLASIDIMVMPYSSRYDTTGSGIAIECLKMGCVQVVPKGSSMERLALERGAGVVTFSDLTVAAITHAVRDAVEQFEDLQERSRFASSDHDDDALQRLTQIVKEA